MSHEREGFIVQWILESCNPHGLISGDSVEEVVLTVEDTIYAVPDLRSEEKHFDPGSVASVILTVYCASHVLRHIAATVVQLLARFDSYCVVDLRESPPRVTHYPSVDALRGCVTVIRPDGQSETISRPTDGENFWQYLSK